MFFEPTRYWGNMVYAGLVKPVNVYPLAVLVGNSFLGQYDMT